MTQPRRSKVGIRAYCFLEFHQEGKRTVILFSGETSLNISLWFLTTGEAKPDILVLIRSALIQVQRESARVGAIVPIAATQKDQLLILFPDCKDKSFQSKNIIVIDLNNFYPPVKYFTNFV